MGRILAVLALAMPAGVFAQAPAADRPHHLIVPLPADGAAASRGKPYEVVSGDPTRAGVPFVIRIYNYDNQVVPPHWHPEDEHVTVVKGVWMVGAGDLFDRSGLREMRPGDYAMLPKEMRHFAWSKGDTVIQVHGIGPFKINIIDPWLFLSRPSDAARFRFKDGQKVRSSSRGVGHVREGVLSERNKVKQYVVERADGSAFWEFEEDLEEATAGE